LHHLWIQDDIRLTSKLTVNLGLRYEYNEWPHHRRGRMGGFDMDAGEFYWTATNPITGEPANAPKSIAEPERLNFAPRVGFAYRVLPRTVIRSAYGIFYNANFGWEWSTGAATGRSPMSDNARASTSRAPADTRRSAVRDFRSHSGSAHGAAHHCARSRHAVHAELELRRRAPVDAEHGVELNYQGAKGTHLSSFLSTNDPPPGPGDPNAPPSVPAGRRAERTEDDRNLEVQRLDGESGAAALARV
jgi:hypothetical protein